MIRSMTAFARWQTQKDSHFFCWEIRSVNHRYLDVSFRLPDSLRFIETDLRSCFRDNIHRGKLECQLKYQDTQVNHGSMLIHADMVNALKDLGQQLAESYQLDNDLTVSQVLSWPGVVQTHSMDLEALSQQAIDSFKEAIQQLVQIRLKEGDALKVHLQSRLNLLTDELVCCQSLVASQAIQMKEKLRWRLQRLQAEVLDTRVDQEIALLVARFDVNEELVRLETHIAEVHRIVNNEKVAGRRLDFLMQELNREANTLSSKSDSAALTRCAVEMKVLIEQMREQIQNIE